MATLSATVYVDCTLTQGIWCMHSRNSELAHGPKAKVFKTPTCLTHGSTLLSCGLYWHLI